MARIRSIKPEFWTSEQVVQCSPNARLLFIGIWNFADDSGVHPASVKRLKMEIYPGDSFTIEEIAAMVEELLAASLLQKYSVGNEDYWRVTGWKHQKIDQPTYKFPLPDGGVPSTPGKRRAIAESSPNTSQDRADCSPPEGKGGESSGVDVDVESKGSGKIPSRYTQADFDERDFRAFCKAKKEIELKLNNGWGRDLTDEQIFEHQAAIAGKTPKAMREVLERLQGAASA